MHDGHTYPDNAIAALADIKVLVGKAGARARSELLRATDRPRSQAPGDRAYRTKLLATLVRCCETWELVGQCFDNVTFECTNFRA